MNEQWSMLRMTKIGIGQRGRVKCKKLISFQHIGAVGDCLSTRVVLVLIGNIVQLYVSSCVIVLEKIKYQADIMLIIIRIFKERLKI